jgi:acetyl-CoA carboxylase biotin carboxyl carrier protein
MVELISMPDETPTVDATNLLALIDRLEGLLQSSQLSEIEVEAGGTALVLRMPSAILPTAVAGQAAAAVPSATSPLAAETRVDGEAAKPAGLAVLAPLTGLYYKSPSPGAEPFVREGGEVHVGQVIGLIEAMKLFNEIKSDVAGRVVRICVDDGGLVKAKQPLIELSPL